MEVTNHTPETTPAQNPETSPRSLLEDLKKQDAARIAGDTADVLVNALGDVVTSAIGLARVHVDTGLKIAGTSVAGAGSLLQEVSKGLDKLRVGLVGEEDAAKTDANNPAKPISEHNTNGHVS